MICAGFTLPKITGIEPLYGIAFPRNLEETISPTSSGTKSKIIYGATDGEAVQFDQMRGDGVGDYDFYSPIYGQTMGPRCILVFNVDLNLLSRNEIFSIGC